MAVLSTVVGASTDVISNSSTVVELSSDVVFLSVVGSMSPCPLSFVVVSVS